MGDSSLQERRTEARGVAIVDILNKEKFVTGNITCINNQGIEDRRVSRDTNLKRAESVSSRVDLSRSVVSVCRCDERVGLNRSIRKDRSFGE